MSAFEPCDCAECRHIYAPPYIGLEGRIAMLELELHNVRVEAAKDRLCIEMVAVALGVDAIDHAAICDAVTKRS